MQDCFRLHQTICKMSTNREIVTPSSWEKLMKMAREAGISFETFERPKPVVVECPMNEADRAAGFGRYRATRPWFDPQQRRQQWTQYHNSRTHREYGRRWVNAHNRR